MRFPYRNASNKLGPSRLSHSCSSRTRFCRGDIRSLQKVEAVPAVSHLQEPPHVTGTSHLSNGPAYMQETSTPVICHTKPTRSFQGQRTEIQPGSLQPKSGRPSPGPQPQLHMRFRSHPLFSTAQLGCHVTGWLISYLCSARFSHWCL